MKRVAFVGANAADFDRVVGLLSECVEGGVLRPHETTAHFPGEQTVTVTTKYHTFQLQLFCAADLAALGTGGVDAVVCSDGVSDFETLGIVPAELKILVGSPDRLDWCLDREIELVNPELVSDADNLEGFDRVAEALLNHPWELPIPAQPFAAPNTTATDPTTGPAADMHPNETVPEDEIDPDDIESVMRRLLEIKQRVVGAEFDERHRLAEDAMELLSRFIGESSEDD